MSGVTFHCFLVLSFPLFKLHNIFPKHVVCDAALMFFQVLTFKIRFNDKPKEVLEFEKPGSNTKCNVTENNLGTSCTKQKTCFGCTVLRRNVGSTLNIRGSQLLLRDHKCSPPQKKKIKFNNFLRLKVVFFNY